MTGMQGTNVQLTVLRDDSLRRARQLVKESRESRLSAQQQARKLEDYTWDIAFGELEPPTEGWKLSKLQHQRNSLPVLQNQVGLLWRRYQAEEKQAEEYLLTARKATEELARRRAYRGPALAEEGLLVLIRMCLVGWQNRRALV